MLSAICLLSDGTIPGQHQPDLYEVESYSEINLANIEMLILSKVRNYLECVLSFSCQQK